MLFCFPKSIYIPWLYVKLGLLTHTFILNLTYQTQQNQKGEYKLQFKLKTLTIDNKLVVTRGEVDEGMDEISEGD